MRRAQFDGGSQPKRNLVVRPKYRTTATQVAHRANYCINPSFETVNGTSNVRTNLSVNPRGVFSMSEYQSGGTTAITPNVTLTDNPDGFTTANRVTYTTGGNPGVVLANPLISGTVYSAQVWVYHESIEPAPGSQGLAQAGVASQPSPPAIVQGVWQKLTWTFTASGTSHAGYRVSSQSGGSGSFLITGVMVEAHPTVNSFFDGASTAGGDFTYAWAGTANASVSYKRAPYPQYYTATSTATIYQSSAFAQLGTKSCAAFTRGGNGDGFYYQDLAVTVGTTYTVSAWVYLTAAVPNLTIQIRWKDAAQGILADVNTDVVSTLVVGNWVRVSATSTAPTNAAWLQGMFRILASHTATTFHVDGAMIENTPTLMSYFDGATAATTDFTHVWTGTPNASNSQQKSTPALGQLKSIGSANAKFFGYRSSDTAGFYHLRWASPANTGASGWRVAGLDANCYDYTKITAGKTYTLGFRYRASGWPTSSMQVMIADGGSTNQVVAFDTAQSLNIAGWVDYRRTFVAVRDMTINSQLYISLPQTPSTTTDGVLDIMDHYIVEGVYAGDYIDSANPFSKWEGTADASTTLGYPPQLYDIAGKPLVDVTAVGTYTLDNSFGTTEGRTFYTIVENLSEVTGSLSGIMQYGDNALSDTVPNTYIQYRIDSNAVADGISNLMVRRTGGAGMFRQINQRRHVSTWGINDSGQIYHGINGAAPAVDTGATMSLLHQKLVVLSNDAYHNHIRTIAYRGVHDDATRIAVSRYLGNKYGCPVA